jgi:hypothetical protein
MEIPSLTLGRFLLDGIAAFFILPEKNGKNGL